MAPGTDPEQDAVNTWRDPANAHPFGVSIAASKGASCAHSSSVSNRRFTAGFCRITCIRPKLTSDPRNTPYKNCGVRAVATVMLACQLLPSTGRRS
jgi:hypothetical protein